MPPQLLLPVVHLDWDPLPNTASGVFVVVPACVVKTDYCLHCAARLCSTSTKDCHLRLVQGICLSKDTAFYKKNRFVAVVCGHLYQHCCVGSLCKTGTCSQQCHSALSQRCASTNRTLFIPVKDDDLETDSIVK